MAEAIIAEQSPRSLSDRLSFDKSVRKRSVLVVFLVLWGYVVYRVGAFWQASPDYAYGWFVPILCACLLWERWKSRPQAGVPEASTGPLILIGCLVAALLAGGLSNELLPERRFSTWVISISAIGISLCLVYLAGGQRWANHFAFPFFFFLVAAPWPSRIDVPLVEILSKLNAAASAAISNVGGIPAMRQGTLIQTGNGLVGVDEACSGIRSFQSSVMIALFLGELFRYGLFRRIFFLASGVALALVCNIARTTYLVRVCDRQGNEAVTASHDPAGFTILGITLAGLLVLAWAFRPRRGSGSRRRAGERSSETLKSEQDTSTGALDQQQPKTNLVGKARPRFAFAVTLAILAGGIAILEIALYNRFSAAEIEARKSPLWAIDLPRGEAGFAESKTPVNIRQMLRPDEALHCQWGDPASAIWQLYYFRWKPAGNLYEAVAKGARAKGHAADVCLSFAGMVLEKDLLEAVGTVNGVTLLKRVQRFNDRGRPLHVLSCYWTPLSSQLQVDLKREAGPFKTAAAVVDGLRKKDRSRSEQRVIKVGVWGIRNDAEAVSRFDQLLSQMIRP